MGSTPHRPLLVQLLLPPCASQSSSYCRSRSFSSSRRAGPGAAGPDGAAPDRTGPAQTVPGGRAGPDKAAAHTLSMGSNNMPRYLSGEGPKFYGKWVNGKDIWPQTTVEGNQV